MYLTMTYLHRASACNSEDDALCLPKLLRPQIIGTNWMPLGMVGTKLVGTAAACWPYVQMLVLHVYICMHPSRHAVMLNVTLGDPLHCQIKPLPGSF